MATGRTDRPGVPGMEQDRQMSPELQAALMGVPVVPGLTGMDMRGGAVPGAGVAPSSGGDRPLTRHGSAVPPSPRGGGLEGQARRVVAPYEGQGQRQRRAGGGVCRWHTSTADRAEGETIGPYGVIRWHLRRARRPRRAIRRGSVFLRRARRPRRACP